MDDADRAKAIEMADRRRALALARAAAERESEERPIMIGGVAHCKDCREPIAPARLAARPGAARCLPCKARRERRR